MRVKQNVPGTEEVVGHAMAWHPVSFGGMLQPSSLVLKMHACMQSAQLASLEDACVHAIKSAGTRCILDCFPQGGVSVSDFTSAMQTPCCHGLLLMPLRAELCTFSKPFPVIVFHEAKLLGSSRPSTKTPLCLHQPPGLMKTAPKVPTIGILASFEVFGPRPVGRTPPGHVIGIGFSTLE